MPDRVSSRTGSLPASPATPSRPRRSETARAELVVGCLELAGFLRGLAELPWAQWLQDRASDIQARRPAAVEALLEAYVGLGGIVDLYLCPEAGHEFAAGAENAVNEQFLIRLARLGELARRVAALER